MICFLVHCCISLIILVCFSQCLVYINIRLCRALWCQGRIMSLKWKISFILHSLWLFCSYFYIPRARCKFCIFEVYIFLENISVLIKKCICCLLIVNYSLFDCQIWHFVSDFQIVLINDSQSLMNFKRFHTLNDLQLISF